MFWQNKKKIRFFVSVFRFSIFSENGSQIAWNPESIGMESGIQPSKSGIHCVESGIRDSLGFLYMGRFFAILKGQKSVSCGDVGRDELRWSACFRRLRFSIFRSVFRGDVWHGAFRCGRCFRPLNSRICVMSVINGVLPEHRHLFFEKIYFRCEVGL